MNVFGIGLPEMVLIMVLALLIFGPKKLPEIGRSLGKAIRSFQDASREFEAEFKREAEQLEKASAATMQADFEPEPPAALTAATQVQAVSESEVSPETAAESSATPSTESR